MVCGRPCLRVDTLPPWCVWLIVSGVVGIASSLLPTTSIIALDAPIATSFAVARGPEVTGLDNL